jgi:hypothetical protein
MEGTSGFLTVSLPIAMDANVRAGAVKSK